MQDTFKTILLFGVLGAILVTLGRFVGGVSGMWFMLVISLVMNISMYYFSDKIALKSAGATPLNKKKYGSVFKMVEDLSREAKISKPKLFLGKEAQPNAFATGRNPKYSSILVTSGLLDNLDREELRGVLAHEIAHIKNRDILLATVASVVASLISGISDMLMWGNIFGSSDEENQPNPLIQILLIIIAPIAALIVQMAISRSREFKADETGAKLAKDNRGLANALLKIEAVSKRTPVPEVSPAFCNLYIKAPFGGMEGVSFFQRLFSTHPPVPERVERLMETKI